MGEPYYNFRVQKDVLFCDHCSTTVYAKNPAIARTDVGTPCPECQDSVLSFDEWLDYILFRIKDRVRINISQRAHRDQSLRTRIFMR